MTPRKSRIIVIWVVVVIFLYICRNNSMFIFCRIIVIIIIIFRALRIIIVRCMVLQCLCRIESSKRWFLWGRIWTCFWNLRKSFHKNRFGNILQTTFESSSENIQEIAWIKISQEQCVLQRELILLEQSWRLIRISNDLRSLFEIHACLLRVI